MQGVRGSASKGSGVVGGVGVAFLQMESANERTERAVWHFAAVHTNSASNDSARLAFQRTHTDVCRQPTKSAPPAIVHARPRLGSAWCTAWPSGNLNPGGPDYGGASATAMANE
jgi:hypothetical protein